MRCPVQVAAGNSFDCVRGPSVTDLALEPGEAITSVFDRDNLRLERRKR